MGRAALMGSGRRAFTNTAAWKALRAQVYAEEWFCHLCGWAVDFDAEPRTAAAPSLDHLVPLMDDPWLAIERSNVRLAHVSCNASRRAAPLDTSYTEPRPSHEASREW